MIAAFVLLLFSFPAKVMMGTEVTETNDLSPIIKSTDPTMVFFSMDYGKCHKELKCIFLGVFWV